MKSHCSLRIFFLLMLLSIARRSSARTAAFSPVLRRAGSNISRLPSWSGTTRPTRCLPQSPMYCVSSSSLSSKVSSSLLDDVFVEGDDYDDDFCLSPQDSDVEEGSTGALLPGMPEGFYVVKKYHTPDNGFDLSAIAPDVIERLELTTTNVSVPIALMLLDPDEYPSLSRARKASRKGACLVHRGMLSFNSFSDPTNCFHGRVGDRVFPGDWVGIQTRMGDGKYSALSHDEPPFELPVVYEDDHFAIVDKPAGVVVYSHRGAGHGRMTVRAALPFALTPPRMGTFSVLRRPMAVHRLDRPTSGLLLIAKTKPAMVELTRQFVQRKVKKTYTAILNGIPDEALETSLLSRNVYELGMDVDPTTDEKWQIIDYPLEDKHAITAWRALSYSKSLKAQGGTLTLVELKLKTGRYHQLRRHMAWVVERPLVGDKVYDGGRDEAMALRERGLFLCSNRISFEHPYFNTEVGRREWESMSEREKFGSGLLHISDDGVVRVTASIDLPEKFEHFLAHEEERAIKFNQEEKDKQ